MNSEEQQQRQDAIREDNLQRIRGMRLMDDTFMSFVFDGNIPCTELLLNIIFDREDMIVTEVIGQHEIKNINGHSVRLDIFAADSTGKKYDIEVQRADRGAVAQRARFNSAMLDTKLLKAGEKDYAALVDSYVIFITEKDVLEKGLPIYEIDRVIKQTGELFGDGSHILYVNGAYQSDESRIGKLMHDFRCTEPGDMNFTELADRAKYFKETKGGQEFMCRVLDDVRDQAVMNDRIEIAMNMIRRGRPLDEIAEDTKLPIEKVRELANQKSA